MLGRGVASREETKTKNWAGRALTASSELMGLLATKSAMSLISGSYSLLPEVMLGAPESLAAEVEKVLREAGREPAMRRAPTEAERRQAGEATRGVWRRSCLEAERRLRLTADMVAVN